MALMRPVSRDLLVAALIQFFALLLAVLTLDGGQFTLATERLSAGYWFGVIIVLIRRHNALTRGDHLFLRFGLLLVLILGLPVTFSVWAHRGDM